MNIQCYLKVHSTASIAWLQLELLKIIAVTKASELTLPKILQPYSKKRLTT